MNSDTTFHDVVFIGTSRIQNHVDPRIIDSICGVNSVCVTIQGSSIVQQYALLKKYLQKHRAPKLVVLGLDYETLNAALLPFRYPDYYENLDDTVFGPVNIHAVTRFKNRALFQYVDFFILYSAKTDYQKFAALAGALGSSQKFDNVKEQFFVKFSYISYYKGFQPVESEWNEESERILKGNEKLIYDQAGFGYLEDFIETSRQHFSKVMMVFPPVYIQFKRKYPNVGNYSERITATASKLNVPYLDYTNDSVCYSKKYFRDPMHMKTAAAENFSVKLAGDINRYLGR